jgi:hypothetical protein
LSIVPHLPPPPADGPRATAPVALRFEDVTQDGRVVLEALPNATGPTVWQQILGKDPAALAMYKQGIVPVLSRVVLAGTAGPFSANRSLDAEGTCRLARTDDGRFMVEMWAEVHGTIGRTYGRAERQGERALAGRLYAEHVLTRPFAPAGERRVTSLDFEGAPQVRATRPASAPFDAILELPAGAIPLEPAMRLDPVPVAFGVVHTDSNRHVNSLVYLRVFEEAALRRFKELGKTTLVLSREIEIGYRKPCFAGQTVRVLLRAFELGARLGVVAGVVPEADAAMAESLAGAKPYAYVQILFD